jgi:hypothetical protein
LVIGVQEVGRADLNLTILTGAGRRARPLAGLLRLAAPATEIASTLGTADSIGT